MSLIVPLELMPWVTPQFLDAAGQPLEGYFLVFFNAGLTSRQNVYSDWLQNTSLGSQVIIDATGYPSDGASPVSIYLQANGYKVLLCPPLPNDPTNPDTAHPIRTMDGVENVGQTFFSQLGLLLSAGAKSVTDGYTITDDDVFVTFNGSGSGVLNFPDVTTRGLPIIVQNVSAISCVQTANGAQTFNGTAATTFTLAAGTTPKWPVMVWLPYATSSTWLNLGGLYTT